MNQTTIGPFLEDGGPNTSTFWNRTHRMQFRIYNMCSFIESTAVINWWGLVISPCSYYECGPRLLSLENGRKNRTKKNSLAVLFPAYLLYLPLHKLEILVTSLLSCALSTTANKKIEH